MEILEFERADMPLLMALYKELVPPFLTFNDTLEQCLTKYDAMKSDEHYCLLVAKENGELLGSALGIWCQCLLGRFLVIEDVIVKENTRGKGIGKKLMAGLDDFAIKNGCAYAFLVSSGFRHEAHKFYESIGYNDDAVGFRKCY